MSRKVRFPRCSGVLMHPTSLPGRHGIGDFGPGAYRFIDWLLSAGQSLWQVCPLGPTGYGDSPYQCLSAFAGNPLLISLDRLIEEGLLLEEDVSTASAPASGTGPEEDPHRVDYGRVIRTHLPLLRQAWRRFEARADEPQLRRFERFTRRSAAWLEDYVLFAALKDEAGGAPWYEWEKELRVRTTEALEAAYHRLAEECRFHRFVQFVFFSQWDDLRHYAQTAGISIIGDMPIFVAHDSAESWARPELFQFDQQLRPTAVAGVPPDYFSRTGQLWGNPLYDWEAHRREHFQWWIDLFRSRFELFDYLRVDHFRGFQAYWRVPWGNATAERGEWIAAPGKELFDRIFDVLGPLPIIAEDLGVITDEVVALMDHCGFPGMKILQFAFDSGDSNDYLPHNFDPHSVVYTGTHDNNTVQGWFRGASAHDRSLALAYIHGSPQEIHWDFVRTALASVSDLAVIPLQEFFGLGSEARMNIPGTTGGNWQWRVPPAALDESGVADRLHAMTERYGRTH